MFKRFLFLSFAVLTFGIGVGVSSLSTAMFRRRPELVLTLKIQSTPATLNAEMKRTYQSLAYASGRAGRYEACFGKISSSDGMTFSSTSVYFDSQKQAQRELQKRLKKALEIVSREELLDETGRVVGEQVVATFPPYENASTPSAELIVVNGSDFVSIGSSSLRNIREYKKGSKP